MLQLFVTCMEVSVLKNQWQMQQMKNFVNVLLSVIQSAILIILKRNELINPFMLGDGRGGTIHPFPSKMEIDKNFLKKASKKQKFLVFNVFL